MFIHHVQVGHTRLPFCVAVSFKQPLKSRSFSDVVADGCCVSIEDPVEWNVWYIENVYALKKNRSTGRERVV